MQQARTHARTHAHARICLPHECAAQRKPFETYTVGEWQLTAVCQCVAWLVPAAWVVSTMSGASSIGSSMSGSMGSSMSGSISIPAPHAEETDAWPRAVLGARACSVTVSWTAGRLDLQRAMLLQ